MVHLIDNLRRQWDRQRVKIWVLAGIVLALYSNALHGPFVLDDRANIATNEGIRQLWPLSRALNPPPGEISFYTRPIVNLTMCVDYALGGTDPFVFHFSSVVWHIAVVLAFFAFARRWLNRAACGLPIEGAAFLAAVLFAVHPLATSAVNYASQRGEILVTFFLLLVLIAVDQAVRESSRLRRWLLWSGAWLAMLLGMGSKETMAVGPAVVALYDRVYLASSWREVFRKRGIFYLALCATLAWPISRHLSYSPHVNKELLQWPIIWRYWAVQAWGLSRYLRLVIWPHPLIFDYGTQLVDQWHQVRSQIIAAPILAALVAYGAWRGRWWSFAPGTLGALLLPAWVIPVLGQPLAEHRMYGPLAFAVGGIILAALRAYASRQLPRAVWVAAALIIVAFAALTRQRNAVYQDEERLLSDSLAKWPFSARAFYNRARVRVYRGAKEEAWADLERAITARSQYPDVHIARARLLYERQEYEAALHELTKAFLIKPTGEVAAMAAGALANLGRHREALERAELAFKLEPDSAFVMSALSWVLATAPDASVRDPGRALAVAQEAFQRAPGQPDILDTFAVALAANGRFQEAIQWGELALRIAEKKRIGPLAERIRRHLEAFREGRPWQEP